MRDPNAAIMLSSAMLDPASGLRRESPRPPALRNAAYDAAFEWDTLFYDCYRVGPYVVMQGPPFLNLLAPLLASDPLAPVMRRWLGRPRVVSINKRGEIWWRSAADSIALSGPIGDYILPVQPNMAHLFAGRRVIRAHSKDNAPRWISDWIRYYARAHGADGVLIHDNGSTLYTASALQAELRAQFPDIMICVIDWPFRFGPQGGLAGAVNGQETPWDSDFCTTGMMQHARHRFLRDARSVLSVDIDEMVLSANGQSIFAATETSRRKLIKFAGTWISSATPECVLPQTSRHADFVHRDLAETRECPPKWCVVPGSLDPFRTSWSEHNVFQSPHNRCIDPAFSFRHMKAISNSWKEDRRIEAQFDPAQYARDDALADAFARAGLPVSTPTG